MHLRKGTYPVDPVSNGEPVERLTRGDRSLSSTFPAWSVRGIWLAFLLIALTSIAYLPALKNGYIWDDDSHLTANPCVVGPLGVKEIWTSRAARICPLVQTTFWVEHRFWGLAPFPYHLVNILVHAAAAAVLWAVLRSLRVRGAWLGAALWALHPVQVETAAWITELKNTQSCLFYLLATLFFIKSADLETSESLSRRRVFYALSLLCGAAAMASKTATVILPLVLALVVWWLDRAWKWPRLLKIIPFLFFSAAASLLSLWTQHLEGANETEFALGKLERLVIAGKVVWFYLAKLIWPHPLIFIYPRWQIDPTRLVQWFPSAAVLVLLLVFWRYRHGRLRPLFFAFVYFIAALLPVLGLLSHYFLRFSFVGDHFQYLASIGPLALAAAGITSAFGRLKSGARVFEPAFCAVLLALLGTLTWRQCANYRDSETLWRASLAQNPRCWMAQNNLGGLLGQTSRLDEAMTHLRLALEIRPDYAEAENNLANALNRAGRPAEALAHYERALQLKPNYPTFCSNLGSVLLQLKRPNESLTYLEKAVQGASKDANAQSNLANTLLELGRVDEAIHHYRLVAQLRAHDSATDRAAADYNLANPLVRKGQIDEAFALYRQAIALDPHLVDARKNLANALLQNGSVEEAVTLLRSVVDLVPKSKSAERAESEYNLGNALLRDGQTDKAIDCFREALALRPNYAEACNNLGGALIQKGSVEEAIPYLQKVIELRSNRGAIPLSKAYCNLGDALIRLGRIDEAMVQLENALDVRPDSAEAHFEMGNALSSRNQIDDAIAHYNKALEIQPDYADACNNLGSAFLAKRRFGEAIESFQKALTLSPQSLPALNNLALQLATCPDKARRDGPRALEFAQKTAQISAGKDPFVLHILAAAYAQNGQFLEAGETAQKALSLTDPTRDSNLTKILNHAIALYRSHLPYDQDPK